MQVFESLSLWETLRPSRVDNSNPWQRAYHAANVHRRFCNIGGPIVVFGNKNRVRISESRRVRILQAARARILAFKLSHE
jgi:hypothetical protein